MYSPKLNGGPDPNAEIHLFVIHIPDLLKQIVIETLQL